MAHDEDEEEFEEEYEEEYEGGSLVDAVASASWRRMVVLPLILVLFTFGIWFLWKRNRDRVFGHSSYQLMAENIEYTLPPEWIDSNRDVLAEVMKIGSLEDKRISDAELTVQVAGAFEHHPWVKEVDRVRIVYPAKLQVEVTYREPVGMVILPNPDPAELETKMLPVDANAVHLPEADFTEEYANTAFPQIDVGNGNPSGPVGSLWGDTNVEHAAKLAELLHADWEFFGEFLVRIERSSQPTSTSVAADFDIIGRPAPNLPPLVVHWGRAPGEEQVGEPSAESKLKHLRKWVNEAKTEGWMTVGEIDLRSSSVLQNSLHTARKESIRAAQQAGILKQETLLR